MRPIAALWKAFSEQVLATVGMTANDYQWQESERVFYSAAYAYKQSLLKACGDSNTNDVDGTNFLEATDEDMNEFRIRQSELLGVDMTGKPVLPKSPGYFTDGLS